MDEVLAENARLRHEVASLRASLGQATGAEPVGCPCPGACSAIALQDRLSAYKAALEQIRDQELSTLEWSAKGSMRMIAILALAKKD